MAYNPATSAMAATPVQSYSYDANGRLASAWDPRITPNLKTSYTYNTAGRLAGLTPPGLAAWTLGYDGTGRVSTVSRPDLSGPTAVSTVVYGVPFTGVGAPFDVGATAAASWGQTADLAATATAVFTPSRVPAGAAPATIAGSDWPWASIDYLDVNGRSVNSASYGAAAWQSDATQYDSTGNTVWSLTAGNRAQALSPTTATDPAVAATTTTADRANLLASTTVYDPLNPSNVTDTFGPTHPVDGTGSGAVDARSHTSTAYDQGGPADGTTYNLPTTTTQSAQTLDGVDHNPVTTVLGYAAVNAGDPTGWSLRQATTSTVQMGATPSAADLTTTTRYNTAGQTISHALPGSSGSDARTRATSYYTATGTGSCVSPAFAGLLCQVGPAAQPASGNPLPVATTSYNTYNQATATTEAAGATTRTSTTSYDTAGRPARSSIVVTPTAAGGTPVPAITTAYSPTTGLLTTSTAGGQRLTIGYDSVGRVHTYSDATGTTATTNYDLAGRVASVNDGKGTTSYTYDTAGEHRGLVTSQDLGTGSTAGSTLTALWDAAGNLISQSYPNGMAAVTDYNNTGTPTALTYTAGGNTLISYAATVDPQGRTATATGNGTAEHYGYDPDGRLTMVQDTQAGAGSTAACTTRSYTFDQTSNRTALTGYPDGAGGTSSTDSCSTNTTPTTTGAAFDQADRITSAGYSYDALGRTTTLPAADAISTGPAAGTTGTLTVGYYSNDMVASQNQGGATRGYTLDPAQNRIAAIDDGTTTTVNCYTDSTDSPAWTLQEPTAVPARTPATTTWTRHLHGLDGTLAGAQTDAGVLTWNLTDLQGNTVATINNTTPAAPTPGTTYSEYGVPRTPAAAPTYGWLGTHQRSAATLGGLILMGVRLYNPQTGRFLTPEPIYGGNTNPYTYPTNPIDTQDLDGRCWSWLSWACHAAKATGHAAAWAGRKAWSGAKWAGRTAWSGAKWAGRTAWHHRAFVGKILARVSGVYGCYSAFHNWSRSTWGQRGASLLFCGLAAIK